MYKIVQKIMQALFKILYNKLFIFAEIFIYMNVNTYYGQEHEHSVR